MSTRRLTFVMSALFATVLTATGCSAPGSVEPVTPHVVAAETDAPTSTEDDSGPGVAEYPTELPPGSFTAVSAAALSDPGAFGDPFSGAHFLSPSGNLGCAITGPDNGELWGCVAVVADWTWPNGPGTYCYDPEEVVGCGSGIEVDGSNLPHPRRRGDPGFPAAISVYNGNSPALGVLQYGQSVTYSDVTCYSESRGMTCVNNETGHGFVIAKDLNIIF